MFQHITKLGFYTLELGLLLLIGIVIYLGTIATPKGGGMYMINTSLSTTAKWLLRRCYLLSFFCK
ncbi:hypothetical protein T230_02630 [Tannerella sp. oral taxon BU063 isolate Cell 1/3]|uniref:Uncharacterized protein n=1 Tax=Tannerella sp. oral taxon BU063 isolate Cell 1/3 TaxID=1411022 RepID=W2CST9_9BACT|nr:hypothetical protein T230_02630 [Tannerella sp. oral taxon BU063 isolate Cell 1/3]